MADEVDACCVAAREAFLKRVRDTIASYPFLKQFPCPTCRRIVRVRLWGPPDETDAAR